MIERPKTTKPMYDIPSYLDEELPPKLGDWYAALFKSRTEAYTQSWPESWKLAMEEHTNLVRALCHGEHLQKLERSPYLKKVYDTTLDWPDSWKPALKAHESNSKVILEYHVLEQMKSFLLEVFGFCTSTDDIIKEEVWAMAAPVRHLVREDYCQRMNSKLSNRGPSGLGL